MERYSLKSTVTVHFLCSKNILMGYFWHASDSTQVATTVVFEKVRKAIIGNIAFLLSVQ